MLVVDSDVMYRNMHLVTIANFSESIINHGGFLSMDVVIFVVKIQRVLREDVSDRF
jgi:hypothetical protein